VNKIGVHLLIHMNYNQILYQKTKKIFKVIFKLFAMNNIYITFKLIKIYILFSDLDNIQKEESNRTDIQKDFPVIKHSM